MQRMAVLEFTPRGSKPTMSKRLRSSSGKSLAETASRTKSTPDAPGPPGSTTSEPMRWLRSVAGSSRTEMLR